jgi:hypothetical protein
MPECWGAAVQKTIAILGSALFFVVNPYFAHVTAGHEYSTSNAEIWEHA